MKSLRFESCKGRRRRASAAITALEVILSEASQGSLKFERCPHFSVSSLHLSALLEYIANQEAHHRKETFQEEFLRLLDTYGVEVDERLLWD